jgi:hypothetical protein
VISRRASKRQIALAAALLPVSGVLRLPSIMGRMEDLALNAAASRDFIHTLITNP